MMKRFQKRRQFDAAAEEMEIAIRLGADSWEVNKEAGRFYLDKRDVPTATRFYEKAAELMESDFHAWAMLATCYRAVEETSRLGEVAKMMVSEAQRAVQEDPSNGAALGILAGGYALLGEKEKTREWIERALLVDPDNLNMRYNFACVLAACLRDTEEAIRMLQSTLPVAAEYPVRVAEIDTDLDSLRDDPRFQKLMADAKKRLGMADMAAATSAAPPSKS
jgi:adenylate cyclase